MTRAHSIAAKLACLTLTLGLSACSGGGLTTGTLLGGAPGAQKAPTPETPTDRALFVATTAARAQRCGYVFDPAAVRQGYIAFEAQQGAAPDQIAKVEKSYDYTSASITKTIAANEDYCSDGQTSIIKRDLNQVLAGDYSSPAKKIEANVGWWNATKSREGMDREKIFNPQTR
ncbi:MAG: hypothetical protein AB7O57_20720 [Hyphomicrobiaceae bacterium]